MTSGERLAAAFRIAIAEGDLDAYIDDIANVLAARREYNAIQKGLMFVMNDRVFLNKNIRPKRLYGMLGTVVGQGQTGRVKVRLDRQPRGFAQVVEVHASTIDRSS